MLEEYQNQLVELDQLIAMCSDADITMKDSLVSDRNAVSRQIAEMMGESVEAPVDGDDVDKIVSGLRSDRLAVEFKLESKRSARLREEEFRQKVNPSYSYETDPLRKEEMDVITKLTNELSSIEARLVDVEGNVTFRVGFPEWEEVDNCFSPTLQPVRSLEAIFEMISGEKPTDIEDIAGLFVDLCLSLPRDKARDFMMPVIKLAQKTAANNKAKSFKYMNDLKRTPFDSFCRRIDRIMLRVAKKLSIPTENSIVPGLDVLTEALQNEKNFTFATEAINLNKEKKDCGDTWDDSIMETLNWLNEAEIITMSAIQARSGVDLQDLERLYTRMNGRLAHKSEFFAKSNDPEHRAWSENFDLFRRKREETRILINTLKAERSKRVPSPVRRGN